MSAKRRRILASELVILSLVVGTLALMLFPVFVRARDRARQAVCFGNMRSIVRAVLMYAADYDGYLPPEEHDPEAVAYFDTGPGGGASCYSYLYTTVQKPTSVTRQDLGYDVLTCNPGNMRRCFRDTVYDQLGSTVAGHSLGRWLKHLQLDADDQGEWLHCWGQLLDKRDTVHTGSQHRCDTAVELSAGCSTSSPGAVRRDTPNEEIPAATNRQLARTPL